MANFQPKTRIVNGQRVDITTNQPYTPRLSQGTTVIPPMKAGDLGTVQPIALPPDTLSTTSTGFSGFMEQYLVGQQEQIKEQQKLAETAQKDQSTQSDALKETMRTLVGLPAQQAQMEQKAGIDQKTELVTKYTNQLEAEQQGLVRQVERIRKNDQGLFGGGMEQEINRVERESLTKQADLALLQSAANRDLSTAQGIIDRKIELMTEPLKLKLQFDQFFYNENKDQLTKAQDRQFQLMAQSDKTSLDFAQSNQKQIHDAFIMAAQNGAPESVQKSILAASTSEEAMQAAGGYFVDPLDRQYKQAQIANIYADNARLSGGSAGGTGVGGAGDYASDLDAIIGATLSTIPTKFGQAAFQSQMNKARNDADRINLVAAQVLKGQPAEFKNDFRNQSVGVSMIDKAIAELDKGTQTGAISASQQYAANFFGKDFDPALAKINGYITAAIQPYRNSVTGAAWGDQEDQEYQQLFGSIKYSPAELKQRLLQTKELLKSKSAEGLNSFVNPLGVYDNQFETGGLTPQTPDESPDDIYDSVTSPSASGGSWIGNVFKGLWDSLF